MSVITTLPTTSRLESLQALSQDVEQRALQQQILEALRGAENALLTAYGQDSRHHPAVRRIRAALAAAEGARS